MTTVATQELAETAVSATAPVSSDSSARKLWLDAAVLSLILFALSLSISPDAYLSTDVGGKTAAVQAMVDRGDWSTDIGYWAEDLDPEGSAHPFAGTTRMSNGWWVNTTSIQMVVAARPLWQVGGARGALLLPIAGAAMAALAASALFRRFYEGSGRLALWTVGLTTPVTIYAMEFWEHSIGVALTAWAVVWTVDASRGRGVVAARLAGLAFGLAGTMRQEALVYGAVVGIVLSVGFVVGWQQSSERSLRSLVPTLLPAAVMAAAALATVVGYAVVERLYYGNGFRGDRNLGTASQAGDGFTERAEAAWATTIAPLNTFHPLTYIIGMLLLIPLLWLGIEIARGRPLRLPALTLGAVVLLLAMRIVSSGPTFVPGLVATAPIAAVGAVLAVHSRRWQLLAFALAPLPLMWLVQFSEGALPQWGGRYVLLTGLVLVVVGVGELSLRRSKALLGLIAIGAAVTMSGLWWSSIRADDLAADFAAIEAVADGDIVVWYDPFKAREAGPAFLDQRWLSTQGDTARRDVELILSETDTERFLWIDRRRDEPATFEGYELIDGPERVNLSSVLNVEVMVFERVVE